MKNMKLTYLSIIYKVHDVPYIYNGILKGS